jgi:hypothetical protein
MRKIRGFCAESFRSKATRPIGTNAALVVPVTVHAEGVKAMRREVISPLALEDERQAVFEQHDVLRTLLLAALELTTQTLRAHESERAELEGLAGELRQRFRAHLSYEERHLVPLLVAANLWGEHHVRELHAEHARQRAELDTVIEGIADGWDAGRVALTLRSLATELFLDMRGEERVLERPSIPGEPHVDLGPG